MNSWCFIKPFKDVDKIDINTAVGFFKACREDIRLLPQNEKDKLLVNQFKSSVTGKQVCKSGKTKLEHKWEIKGQVVCFQTYSQVYKVSNWKKKKCSALYKENSDIQTFVTHKQYHDSNLHNYSFNETLQLMEKNVPGFGE